VSLIESTHDQKGLAALEKVEFEFSQFSKSHNIDQTSTSLPCTITV
jgi:hypothetical protein